MYEMAIGHVVKGGGIFANNKISGMFKYQMVTPVTVTAIRPYSEKEVNACHSLSLYTVKKL